MLLGLFLRRGPNERGGEASSELHLCAALCASPVPVCTPQSVHKSTKGIVL